MSARVICQIETSETFSNASNAGTLSSTFSEEFKTFNISFAYLPKPHVNQDGVINTRSISTISRKYRGL